MSWVRIWVHLVFSTKNREPVFCSKELRDKLYNHIIQNAKEKGLLLNIVNGQRDHIHCLIALNKDQTISKAAQMIKGESSFWVNQNHMTKSKFYWQDDYWAVSVSESHIKDVQNYILGQDDHHKVKSFAEEVNDFMKKYGWAVIQDQF